MLGARPLLTFDILTPAVVPLGTHGVHRVIVQGYSILHVAFELIHHLLGWRACGLGLLVGGDLSGLLHGRGLGSR